MKSPSNTASDSCLAQLMAATSPLTHTCCTCRESDRVRVLNQRDLVSHTEFVVQMHNPLDVLKCRIQ